MPVNKRYFMKEVADVAFIDVVTNKPAIFFDTLKVSTIENESESAEARGGVGGQKLMSWDYNRTATISIQDALLSDVSLGMLSGNAVTYGTGARVFQREVLTLITDGTAPACKVTIAQTPITSPTLTVTAFKLDNGVMGDEIPVTAPNVVGKDVKFPTGQTAGNKIVVFYEYTSASTEASVVTFTGNKFPAVYKVVGTTIVRDEQGVDRAYQFVIPKAKLQSNFTLTLDTENVSTFDFNLEVLTDTSGGTPKLYDIIRL